MSRAFSDWLLIDGDQRAFLRVGLRVANEFYERTWTEAAGEPGDPDGPDLVDVFDARIDGLWPHEYEWMYLAAVLRDAVTNFELYMEKASREVLGRHGSALSDAPRWHDLTAVFDALGVTVESDDVRRIRRLRHFLVHQRGELRTEEQRKEFTATGDDSLPPIVVELTEASVLEAVDQLGVVVRSIDPPVWEHTFGGKRIADLRPGSRGPH